MRAELPDTYGHGVRLPYRDLPPGVRSWVEEQLGGPVTGVEDRVGGFAPGCAAVLRTRDRAVFCKATGSASNALAVDLYRGERSRLAALPDHPALPKPLAATDLALADQVWVVTVLPAIPGEPPAHPWTEPVARVVFDRWGDLAATLGSSVDEAPSALPGSGALVAFFGRWAEVAADPDDPWRREPWVRRSLGRLRAADARVQEELVGTVPAHTDLRADNVLVGTDPRTGAPQVWFVDWAAALTAAPWVDPAILACDLVTSRADRSQGGTMDVAAFLAAHPVTAAVEPALRWGMMVALAGALHRRSRLPAPPGLPTLRPWQHRCAEDLLAFVRAADLGSARPIR